MRKEFLLFPLLMVLFLNVKAQDIKIKSEYLKSAYYNVIKNGSQENWGNYVEKFPDRFEDFDSIFGYRNDSKGPLYDMYQQYIDLFFVARQYVSSEEYYEKVINIARTGSWDADAVNLFQAGIVDLLSNDSINPQEKSVFFKVLSSFSNTDITHFWSFYYDGLYPDCYGEKYKSTISALLGYERLIHLMKMCYKDICNSMENDREH